jgi:hypothetical protein
LNNFWPNYQVLAVSVSFNVIHILDDVGHTVNKNSMAGKSVQLPFFLHSIYTLFVLELMEFMCKVIICNVFLLCYHLDLTLA